VIYEQRINTYIILCRGKENTTGSEPAKEKFGIYSKVDDEETVIESYFNMVEFKIKNRAKILMLKNHDKKIEVDYFSIICDSFIENGADEPIEMKIRVLSTNDLFTDDNGEYVISDQESIILEPRQFYTFKNRLLLVSKRKDSENKLCFTEIQYQFN